MCQSPVCRSAQGLNLPEDPQSYLINLPLPHSSQLLLGHLQLQSAHYLTKKSIIAVQTLRGGGGPGTRALFLPSSSTISPH